MRHQFVIVLQADALWPADEMRESLAFALAGGPPLHVESPIFQRDSPKFVFQASFNLDAYEEFAIMSGTRSAFIRGRFGPLS